MEQSLLETIIYAFTIRDSEFCHPQRCLRQSYRLRTRSQPLLFDCTIFCCIVAEMDYSIERTLFSLSSGKASLYHTVDSALPLEVPYTTVENDTVCNHWSKLNKTIYALTVRDTKFLS